MNPMSPVMGYRPIDGIVEVFIRMCGDDVKIGRWRTNLRSAKTQIARRYDSHVDVIGKVTADS